MRGAADASCQSDPVVASSCQSDPVVASSCQSDPVCEILFEMGRREGDLSLHVIVVLVVGRREGDLSLHVVVVVVVLVVWEGWDTAKVQPTCTT